MSKSFFNRLADKARDLFGADLRSLALLRIGLSLLIISDLIVRATSLKAHYTDFGLLPRGPFLEKFSNIWRLSFHFMSGLEGFQAVLFLTAGVLAVLMLFGYRTRLAVFLSWVFLISIQARNPDILQGGDVYLRNLLFWGTFLPLGARYSIDSAINSSSNKLPDRISSVAVLGLFAQIAFLYCFTALIKLSPDSRAIWWDEGSAIYYALSLDQFTKPLGYWLLHFPTLLRIMTRATISFEAIGPFLFFVPFFTGFFQGLTVLLFILFHIGMGLSMALGPFSWAGGIAVLAFLPSGFWDKLSEKTGGLTHRFIAPLRPWGSRLLIPFKPRPLEWDNSFWINGVALFFLVYIFFWNLGTLNPKWAVPQKFQGIGFMLMLDQQWNMFSPPLRDDGWYVIPGKLKNGKEVDLFKNGEPVTWGKPKGVYKIYKNERWRKYMMNLYLTSYSSNRLYYSQYLCRDWNTRHQGDDQVDEFEIYLMKETTLPYPSVSTPEKVLLWKHWCFQVPEDLRGK